MWVENFVWQRVNTICRITTLVICALFASFSSAGVTKDLKGSVLLAEVNDTTLPFNSFELLFRVVSNGKGAMTRQQLLESSIETRLIALHGEKILPQETLMSTTAVGFPVSELLQDEFVGVLRLNLQKQFEAHIESSFEGKLENIVSINADLTQALPTPDGALMLDYALAPALEAQYRALIVAQCTLASGEILKINLLQLFNSQNIQGKISIRQGDVKFVRTQAIIALSKLYFVDWAKTKGLVSAADIDGLKRLVWDKHVKNQVLLHYGLNNDIHDDNLVLSEAYNSVSAEEIKTYYNANKEKFTRILYVDARHIRLANGQDARAVQEALSGGMEFSEAIRKFSIAEDKHLDKPGSLGRILGSDQKDWLHTVVFALNEGVTSRPFRSPQSEGAEIFWEIFHVDKKETGYHSIDSETVRYIAGKDVAMQNLTKAFKLLREQLFQDATIRLNAELMTSASLP